MFIECPHRPRHVAAHLGAVNHARTPAATGRIYPRSVATPVVRGGTRCRSWTTLDVCDECGVLREGKIPVRKDQKVEADEMRHGRTGPPRTSGARRPMRSVAVHRVPGRCARLATAMIAVPLAIAIMLPLPAAAAGPTPRTGIAVGDHPTGCAIPPDRVRVSVIDQAGPNSSVNAWDHFLASVTLTDLDGLPAGCSVVVGLPPMFGEMDDATLYVDTHGPATATVAPNTVATMSVDAAARTLTFTLTGYAVTHRNVTAEGHALAQIDNTIRRGKAQPVTVRINGATREVGTVTGASCAQNCPGLPTGPSQWGAIGDNGTGSTTIQTQSAVRSGDVITVMDLGQAPDQRITGVDWVRGFDCVGTWGDPGVVASDGSCDLDSGLAASVARTAEGYRAVATERNEFFRMQLGVEFLGRGPWTGTIIVAVTGAALRPVHGRFLRLRHRRPRHRRPGRQRPIRPAGHDALERHHRAVALVGAAVGRRDRHGCHGDGRGPSRANALRTVKSFAQV